MSFLVPYCLLIFLTQRGLHKFHFESHYGPVKCANCQVVFWVYFNFAVYVFSQTELVDAAKLKTHKKDCFISCTVCSKCFSFKADYLRHAKSHK